MFFFSAKNGTFSIIRKYLDMIEWNLIFKDFLKSFQLFKIKFFKKLATNFVEKVENAFRKLFRLQFNQFFSFHSNPIRLIRILYLLTVIAL